VEKANEFMKAGMYPQAIELLKKRIDDKPSDGQAHFQLGICYIHTNMFTKADKRFASAVQLNSDYGFQIADEYKKVGINNLQNGHIVTTDKLFKKAFKYQPNLRTDIAKKIFDEGKTRLLQKTNAIPYFNMAVKYDSILASKACELFYNAGMSSTGMEKVNFLKNTMRYGSKHNHEINSFLCDFYFEKGKATYEETRVEYFSKSAKYGHKHLEIINNMLLEDANNIEEPSKREQYLKSISDVVPDKDIFEASIKYFTKRLKASLYDKNKVIEAQGRIVLNKNQWVPIIKMSIIDCIKTLLTRTVLEKYANSTVTNTNNKNVYWAGGGYEPSLGSGKMMYYKEKSGKPATIYYWKYKCRW